MSVWSHSVYEQRKDCYSAKAKKNKQPEPIIRSEFSRKTTAIKEGWYKNQLKLDRIIYWYGSIVAAPGAHERDFRSFHCLKIAFPGNHSRHFIYKLFILIVCSNIIASQNYECGLKLFSWRNYIYLIFISETTIFIVLFPFVFLCFHNVFN